MSTRRSLAALLLMLGLTLAPSFALAAAACATDCCAMAIDEAQDLRGCGAAFVQSRCCGAPAAIHASPAAAAVEAASSVSSLTSALPSPSLDGSLRAVSASDRREAATLALRTSRLRLSVVLRI